MSRHFDPYTQVLSVRVPMRFETRGGRKQVIVPDGVRGSEQYTNRHPNPALLRALARAWRWQRMLDNGEHACIADLARAEGLGQAYVTRILRLASLSPEIMEAIINGKLQPTSLAEFLKDIPCDRAGQVQRTEIQAQFPK